MKGIKGFGTQFAIGTWLSLAVCMGIMSRSWSSFWTLAAIGGFFAAGSLAGAATKSPRKPLRVLGRIGLCAFLLVMVGALLNTAERVYLVNADSYPRFLARNLGTADMHTLERLHAKECKGMGIQVYEKTNYTWVIRCGFDWFGGHTYISNADPYRALRKEGAQ